jgi:hypothetical protein
MIFCIVLGAAIQLSAQETPYSKQNYEISVVEEIHISILDLQRWSLEFVIWD